jgi:hypothetical protein
MRASGHGTMWDFRSPELTALVFAVYAGGDVVSAVYLGHADTLGARRTAGWLAKGVMDPWSRSTSWSLIGSLALGGLLPERNSARLAGQDGPGQIHRDRERLPKPDLGEAVATLRCVERLPTTGQHLGSQGGEGAAILPDFCPRGRGATWIRTLGSRTLGVDVGTSADPCGSVLIARVRIPLGTLRFCK